MTFLCELSATTGNSDWKNNWDCLKSEPNKITFAKNWTLGVRVLLDEAVLISCNLQDNADQHIARQVGEYMLNSATYLTMLWKVEK